MTDPLDMIVGDPELITRVRADRGAFAELYRRHAVAATNLARQFARGSNAEVDDLVSEAFARVLDGLTAGKGPDSAFRAYLFTTLRNTAYDRTRKDSRLTFTDDDAAFDAPTAEPDPVLRNAENSLVGSAYQSLPERWQAVLWYLTVEGLTPAQTGELLGLSSNAVTSLAFRAREGLRAAYLQAHLAGTEPEQCRAVAGRLGAWTRDGLSKREKAQVDAHLETCEDCRALAAELAEVNSGLRVLLAPVLLGGAAAGYLALLGPAGTVTKVGLLIGGGAAVGTTAGTTGAVGGAAAGGAAAGGAAASGGQSVGFLPWLTKIPRSVAVGAGAAAAAVAAAVVIAVSSGTDAPGPTADPGPATPAVVTTSSDVPAGTSPMTSALVTPEPTTRNVAPVEPTSAGSADQPATTAARTSAAPTTAVPTTPVTTAVPTTPATTAVPTTPVPTVPTTPTRQQVVVPPDVPAGTPSSTPPAVRTTPPVTPSTTPTTTPSPTTTTSTSSSPATSTSTSSTPTSTSTTTTTTTPKPAPEPPVVSRPSDDPPVVSVDLANGTVTVVVELANSGDSASDPLPLDLGNGPLSISDVAEQAGPGLRGARALTFAPAAEPSAAAPSHQVPSIPANSAMTIRITLAFDDTVEMKDYPGLALTVGGDQPFAIEIPLDLTATVAASPASGSQDPLPAGRTSDVVVHASIGSVPPSKGTSISLPVEVTTTDGATVFFGCAEESPAEAEDGRILCAATGQDEDGATYPITVTTFAADSDVTLPDITIQSAGKSFTGGSATVSFAGLGEIDVTGPFSASMGGAALDQSCSGHAPPSASARTPCLSPARPGEQPPPHGSVLWAQVTWTFQGSAAALADVELTGPDSSVLLHDESPAEPLGGSFFVRSVPVPAENLDLVTGEFSLATADQLVWNGGWSVTAIWRTGSGASNHITVDPTSAIITEAATTCAPADQPADQDPPCIDAGEFLFLYDFGYVANGPQGWRLLFDGDDRGYIANNDGARVFRFQDGNAALVPNSGYPPPIGLFAGPSLRIDAG